MSVSWWLLRPLFQSPFQSLLQRPLQESVKSSSSRLHPCSHLFLSFLNPPLPALFAFRVTVLDHHKGRGVECNLSTLPHSIPPAQRCLTHYPSLTSVFRFLFFLSKSLVPSLALTRFFRPFYPFPSFSFTLCPSSLLPLCFSSLPSGIAIAYYRKHNPGRAPRRVWLLPFTSPFLLK